MCGDGESKDPRSVGYDRSSGALVKSPRRHGIDCALAVPNTTRSDFHGIRIHHRDVTGSNLYDGPDVMVGKRYARVEYCCLQ